MNQSNRRLIQEHMSSNYATTQEERESLLNALLGAIQWGERIDKENKAYRELQKQKGVTRSCYPP